MARVVAKSMNSEVTLPGSKSQLLVLGLEEEKVTVFYELWPCQVP